jgi:glutamate-1-semialdehyde 2,1-aminomutase
VDLVTDQSDLLARAARLRPGGVLGSHRHGAGLEFVVREARGAHLWDTTGRRYLDHLLSSGPMVLHVSLAHTDADVDEAIAIFDGALGAVAERTFGAARPGSA